MLKQRVLSVFSGAELFFGRHVTGLYRRGASWEVQKKAGGSETFDAVILTMPVPQILQLEGDVTQCETSSKEMSVSVLCMYCIHRTDALSCSHLLRHNSHWYQSMK